MAMIERDHRLAGRLRVTVTYLEMARPPCRLPAAPAVPGLSLKRIRHPGLTLYRQLYQQVGEPWLWSDRRRMDDDNLAEILRHPAVELLAPTIGPELAGYAELDRRSGDGRVNLAYFGLKPAWIGHGIGPWLLGRALALAWIGDTRLLTVNTCTFDHPKALSLYCSLGFSPMRHVTRMITDPRLTGLLPLDAAPHIPLAE
ncbi:GNAT family N-acetyltransferase [uncultured Gammaproteobacteria bacterium]